MLQQPPPATCTLPAACNSREGAENERPERKRHDPNHEVKVAVYAPELEGEKQAQPQGEKPARKTPKIQYRVRRWRPTENE